MRIVVCSSGYLYRQLTPDNYTDHKRRVRSRPRLTFSRISWFREIVCVNIYTPVGYHLYAEKGTMVYDYYVLVCCGLIFKCIYTNSIIIIGNPLDFLPKEWNFSTHGLPNETGFGVGERG